MNIAVKLLQDYFKICIVILGRVTPDKFRQIPTFAATYLDFA